jgi:transposase-like protein
MTKVKDEAVVREEGEHALDVLAREGARRMIAAALEVEVEDYLARHLGCRDERGRAEVVRNGRGRERKVTIGSGTVTIQAPRVNDKRVIDGARKRFVSQILPPYLRRSRNVSEILPALYLRGLSTGDFRGALETLLGPDAAGLSSSSITRLVSVWQEEYRAWSQRSLVDRDYVYVWVDGVHFNVRLEDERLAALVVIGARPDGTKEVIALEDGYRESKESWLSLLRDLKRRGMRAPELAVGDGALGFWAALREVFPETVEQRCWVHKIANVLDKLPKSQQPKAKARLHEMMNAATRKECQELQKRFIEDYQAKYPKATKCLETDFEPMTTLFEFPAEHWKHLRTTNPIESTFATVKLRQRVTKGAGSRAAGLAMAFKLLLLAEQSWRRLDGHTLLPLVRTGKRCADGVFPERDDLDEVARDSTTTRETKAPSVRKIKSTKSGEEKQDAA